MWQANQTPDSIDQVHGCLVFHEQLREIDPLHEFDRFKEHDQVSQTVHGESNLHLGLQVEYCIKDHLKGLDQGQRLVKDDVLDLFIKDEKS